MNISIYLKVILAELVDVITNEVIFFSLLLGS